MASIGWTLLLYLPHETSCDFGGNIIIHSLIRLNTPVSSKDNLRITSLKFCVQEMVSVSKKKKKRVWGVCVCVGGGGGGNSLDALPLTDVV